jgi:hypothetical protein
LQGFSNLNEEPSMRNFILILALGVATSAFAQEPAKDQDKDKATQDRVRAERSAGGIGKIYPDQKANANVGAGPHKERRTGAARRDDESEPAAQSKQSEPDAQSARGATR